MSLLLTMAALIAARTASSAIANITSRVMPFKGSGEAKRMDYQAAISKEQQEANFRFQAQLQEKGFRDKKELARITALWQRQTTFLANIQNCQNALKGKLFDDALRHFPLNIPPLVMLQNAGISTSSITGSIMDDPFTQQILNSLESEALTESAFYTKFEDNLKSSPIALSVFVTPLQIDARVSAKEKIASIVWDNVYQEMESLFIKEYNRGSERPVIFYPGAWNMNAKPGMHASEILYFFTKGMPVVVLEPRFDGKRLRMMFSCWGVGMLGDDHVRQEIAFDMDWNELILPAMYERSKKGLESLKKIESLPPALVEASKRFAHNVTVYETMKEAEDMKADSFCDDISKVFYLTNNDYSIVSDMISNSMGMVMSVISDIHHLVTKGIEPKLPSIRDKYFGQILNNINNKDINSLNESFNNTFQIARNIALTGDIEITPELVTTRFYNESVFERTENNNSMLSSLNNNEKSHVSKKLDSSSIESLHIPTVIANYCQKNGFMSNDIKEQINFILNNGDQSFVKQLNDLCYEQGIELNMFLK